MSATTAEPVERATVYLTPRNKRRLARLRRGEKARKLNEALDRAFEAEERQQAFEALMNDILLLKPTETALSSTEIIRLLRQGKDHEISDLKSAHE